jgi:Double zinc ribbon
MHCPSCGSESSEGLKFCNECGTPLRMRCAQCGFANQPQAKFCGECGAALSPRVCVSTAPPLAPLLHTLLTYTPGHLAEKLLTSCSALEGKRKQVTVLFADLKGSIEVSTDRNPEDARAILDPVLERLMAAVHRYEGSVNEVMGDGIMDPQGGSCNTTSQYGRDWEPIDCQRRCCRRRDISVVVEFPSAVRVLWDNWDNNVDWADLFIARRTRYDVYRVLAYPLARRHGPKPAHRGADRVDPIRFVPLKEGGDGAYAGAV